MSDYVQVPVRSLDYLERAISNVNNRIAYVDDHLSSVDSELAELKKSFTLMMIQQRQQAALQRALTEIIRVRQEVEQKFGNHKQVRDNMLGILQATDTALVTKETISRCSEQLMLNAPKYWLAPCLVALAAWIDKNKDLAIRAVSEAIKRDKEKTCLLFALICRRNQRTEACFEWLGYYLSYQDPHDMKKSVVAFIDAYTNGVFGEERDKTCDDYVAHWIAVLKRDNAQFDQEQKAYWKNFFNTAGAAAAYQGQGYQDLKELSSDFNRIDGFVSRITAVNNEGGAKDQLNQLLTAEVDREKLVNDIDAQLKKLVTDYEEGEETKLRDEETYLNFVKEFEGDEKRAKARMNNIFSRRVDVPVDFAERLCSAVADPTSPISSKKTALFLLKDYVIEAYNEYIVENKDAYPETINLKIEDSVTAGFGVKWAGVTKNGENVTELKKDLIDKYKKAEEEAVAAAKPSTAKMVFVGIFTLGIGAIILNKKFKEEKIRLEDVYSKRANAACRKLESALNARVETNQIVSDFIAKDDWDTIKLEGGNK